MLSPFCACNVANTGNSGSGQYGSGPPSACGHVGVVIGQPHIMVTVAVTTICAPTIADTDTRSPGTLRSRPGSVVSCMPGTTHIIVDVMIPLLVARNSSS